MFRIHLKVCICCSKHGGDVNATDNARQTALHWAAVRGSIAAADVLLHNGARVEAADINGYRVIWNFCDEPWVDKLWCE